MSRKAAESERAIRGTAKFASFSGETEYHATRAILFDRYRGERSVEKTVALESLCGARIHLSSGATKDAQAAASLHLYIEPPLELTLCKVCARLLSKRKGIARLLSHLFHNKRGFRFGLRSLGRQT